MTRGIITAAIFAQATAAPIPTGEWYAPLLNAGAMGVVLLFFMWQFSKKEDERIQAQRDLTKALNSNTQGMMIVVLALKNLDENIKEMARSIANDTATTKP